MMTPRERIEQAIVGGEVDRLPCCFWYHFRTEAWFPQALHAEYRAPASDAALQHYIDGMSRATYEFWRRYQPDLLKVMHDIPYETPEGLPFVRAADDWAKLTPLEPDCGHFGAQVAMLRRLRAMVPDEVPLIETVFNAFYYANKLCEGKLLEHLALAPDAVQEGLRTIQANLQLYARYALTACDGILLRRERDWRGRGAACGVCGTLRAAGSRVSGVGRRRAVQCAAPARLRRVVRRFVGGRARRDCVLERP
jgi:uroporphyrinogen decarboxylase